MVVKTPLQLQEIHHCHLFGHWGMNRVTILSENTVILSFFSSDNDGRSTSGIKDKSADDIEQTLSRAMQTVIDTMWLPLNVGLTVGEVIVRESGNPSTLLVKVIAAAAFTRHTRSG